MKYIKTFIHGLSLLCYVFVGIYVIVCIPYLFRYKPLVVLSGSMEPTFKTGGIIYYKHALPEEIKVGDIITFRNGDIFVSHRVNSIVDNLYETKGDANNTPDAIKVKYSDIVGKDADFCIPYIGYYIKYINEHMYLLVIVAIILVSDFLVSNIGNSNKKNVKEEA
ncbi:MAG: signal peptidase I [Bacilli bacterium]|nr:signal peptidase I [Bacilli bacterium]